MRCFKDQDGVEWEVEADAVAPVRQPGLETRMMSEVPWQVRFTSHAPPTGRFAIVPAEIGMRLDELTEEELRELLGEAG